MPEMFLQLAAAVFVLTQSWQHLTTGLPIVADYDVPYKSVSNTTLAMDVFAPLGLDEPRPVVLCVHGGAWVVGRRSDYHRLCRRLARQGFVAATIDYRLLPEGVYPAPVHDVLDAVQYLQDHAQIYGADPGRFAFVGASAGGHIAAMAALGTERTARRGTTVLRGSGPAAALVVLYAPTDLTWARLPLPTSKLIEAYLGMPYAGAPDQFEAASPLFQAHAAAPPTLVIHGGRDVVVPYAQSVRFTTALSRAGAPALLLTRPQADHGFVHDNPIEYEWFSGVTVGFLDSVFNTVPERAAEGAKADAVPVPRDAMPRRR